MRLLRIYAVSAALIFSTLSFLAVPLEAESAKTVIPAGNSAELASPTPPAKNTLPDKLLNAALSKETRRTLQQAMNSPGH